MNHFEGRVRSMASDGRGVVEAPDGRVFFVPAVWVGDRARFEIVETKKSFGVARVVELFEASPDRVNPLCPHSGWKPGQCGACPWQIATYKAQLEAKQNRVIHALKRLRLDPSCIREIWPSPKKWGYRNRAQFKTDGKVLGFVSSSSSQIAPIEDCVVLSDGNRAKLRTLLETLPNAEWEPRPGQEWNAIDIDDDLLVQDIQLNRRRPFRQANDEQNLAMKHWLKGRLDPLDKSWCVLELFAGSGNFTETIAALGFAKVCASEIVESAMGRLKDLKLSNVMTLEADLFNNASYRKIASHFPRTDLLILDPPREGLKEKAGLFREFPMIQGVGYISCDLATFARDLKDFVEQGFKIVEIQPLDQFPHTPHIEILAWLER